MPIAPHRLIWLNLWVEADNEESADLTRVIAATLSRYGRVTVTSRGPYWRTPALLLVEVELVPPTSTTDCLHDLGLNPDRDGDWPAWERSQNGDVFLHPAVRGATVGEEEASMPSPFTPRDVVVIHDCPAAREEDLVGADAVVHGSFYSTGEPDPLKREWRHHVMPEGRDSLELFASTELSPVGRRVVIHREPPVVHTTTLDQGK
ncbi:hypothetical protein [Kitasatospora purpeofusca]|uniref:hypothetical protein n=1 Tax=Kitasatospora purpeofusca TaxID=67352 RepID=UPI003668580B